MSSLTSLSPGRWCQLAALHRCPEAAIPSGMNRVSPPLRAPRGSAADRRGTKTPRKSQVRKRKVGNVTQSPFRDDVTSTSPSAGKSCACKEGQEQPPSPPHTPGEAAVEMCRRATGKSPAASPGSRSNEPYAGFNLPAEDFALAPALYGGFARFELGQSEY